MFKAYKYRIYPTDEQKVLIHKHFGCCRWVYNYALEKKNKAYQVDGKSLSRFQIQADLPILKSKEETQWLKEVNSQSLQASLENMDKAYRNFFKGKAKFPRFKSKFDNRQSFQVPYNTKVDFDNSVSDIPKIKGIKTVFHRKFEGKIKTSTITKTATNKYYISILVDVQVSIPKQKPIKEKTSVGIDMGIKTFATLSDGRMFENQKHLSSTLKRLKKRQRKLSRKKKGSNNRKKYRVVVARLHEKVANQRKDFIHKVTHDLVTNYSTVCIEDLNVAGMMKNHNLAMSIADVGIGNFFTALKYKAERCGVNVLKIGRFDPSSKMCYNCGNIKKDLTLSDRTYKCDCCDFVMERDEMAAKNIKKFALLKIKNTGG